MNNFLQRLITGLVAAGLTTALIYYTHYGLILVCLIVSALSIWEFMTLAGISQPQYRVSALLVVAATWICVILDLPASPAYLVVPFGGMIFLLDKGATDIFNNLSKWVFGLAYCLLPLILLYRLSFDAGKEYKWYLPLGILFLNWATDSFAYFAGRMFGKHPMAPSISPKKTWEGTIGGVLMCWVFGILIYMYAPKENFSWIVLIFIVSVFNQPGDLIESMLKRSVQIKDSGSILPGHGGMLDRFDSLFTIIPIAYCYLELVKTGFL